MMAREIIEIVERVLCQSYEVLCLLLLQLACFDGDLEREDGSASLKQGEESALEQRRTNIDTK